ncbi:hypothetical protein [Sorangium sp. So ce204]|uniref:hypothetical protein n=1 Tax=Sorangium sp. So ce204 TaxID=3133288 RepID=UPI003F5F54A8
MTGRASPWWAPSPRASRVQGSAELEPPSRSGQAWQSERLGSDRDGDGVIQDGGELFGSATRLGSGGFAKNGFEALRELDADNNGVFDRQDPAFARVLVWSDKNLDRNSAPSEITPLEALGVTSIDLRDFRDMRCDARGNCEGERSAFAFTDAAGTGRRGTVIDVYMSRR